MKSIEKFAAVVLSASAIMLVSCGSSTNVTNTKESSVGRQLTELQDAHARGLVTDREYSKLRKAIIRDND